MALIAIVICPPAILVFPARRQSLQEEGGEGGGGEAGNALDKIVTIEETL